MRSKEFIKEGVDTSPADVQQNHPEIYDFVSKITGPYAPEKAKVNSFDLGDKHYVVLEMGPSAGLDNTRAVMKSKGIGFDNRSENELIGEHNGLRFTISQDKKGPGNIQQSWEFEMPKAVTEADVNSSTGRPWQSVGDILDDFHNKHFLKHGSPHLEASQSGPPDYKITVFSHDDGKDIFIGSVGEFQDWADGLDESINEGETKWDYVCPKGHHTPYEGPGAPEFIVRPCPECGLKARAKKQETVQEAEPVPKPKRKRRENPFGPMHYDDAPRLGQRTRNSVHDVDDGSRGLSNRDRNR